MLQARPRHRRPRRREEARSGITASLPRPTTRTYPNARRGGRKSRPRRRTAERRRSGSRRGTMSLDQALDRSVCPCDRPGVLKEAAVVMGREHDSEKLEGQLPRVGLGSEVALVDGEANRLGDRAAQLALPGGKQVADGARAIVVFGRSGKDEACAAGIVRL